MEAVRLMQERRAQGVSLAQVGRELDVRPDLLRAWAHQAERRPGSRAGRSSRAMGPSRCRSSRCGGLQREKNVLRQERDMRACWGWDGHLHDADDPTGMAPDFVFHQSLGESLIDLFNPLLWLINEGVYGVIDNYLSDHASMLGTAGDVAIYVAGEGEWGFQIGNSIIVGGAWTPEVLGHEYAHWEQSQGMPFFQWWFLYLTAAAKDGSCNKYDIAADRASGYNSCLNPGR